MGRRQHWLSLTAALLLLNASLSFDNLWPTPAITWRGHVSIELAVFVLILFLTTMRRRLSAAALSALSSVWTLLILGRYAQVTAPALYGRDVNLYWDLRFVPDVASMAVAAAPRKIVLLGAAIAVGLLVLLYGLVRRGIGRLVRGMLDRHERRVLVSGAALAIVLFAIQAIGSPGLDRSIFSTPVVPTYARQVRLITGAALAKAGAPVLPATPTLRSNLSRVRGTDVLLVFIESYGAITYDAPRFREGLVPARQMLDAAIRDTNREVVSGFVESPTFGGSSWLAHLSLMSGIQVRDPDTNALLMSQKRNSMVSVFHQGGFRTIALMPGLKQNWPEGAFYGFDEIDDGSRLGYKGPWFGWFEIPDQFTFARLDALETARSASTPLFVFLPTLSTHFPFVPTPPYQPDWSRVLTKMPYDPEPLDRSLSEQIPWEDFGPAYVDAIAYAHEVVSGYLRLRPNRDFVMILIGDHQPPALVSGEGVSWDVPVHVIASRHGVLERLTSRGFSGGLTPSRPIVGRMNDLLPILLAAFGEP